MIRYLARHRVALGWAVALAVLCLAAPTACSLGLGIPLAAIGLAVRGVAAGTIRKGRALAQTGPYGLTRNPLYLGSSLMAVGFGVMSGSAAGAALLIAPSAALYPLIIRNEEAELRARFGPEFDEFRRRVPCFFPRRLRARVLGSFSLRQFMANREYNAAIGFLAATGVLAIKYLLSQP